MYEYIDPACRVYEDTDCQERNMFQLSRVPQPMEHWQDYIDLVKNNGDENAFLVFLHFYEPTINGKVESFVNRYGLHGHFADVKMAYPVCKLCQDHEKAGFIEGIRIGVLLAQEVAK